ncbi:lipopolysaccharide biosynthesis protein [Saccharicrinis sp. FJH54]|uniref:lipopolysaccharide biosynthesis protein n=1 Tax=Saccharicrinis sp. FJH54 TaxID=3344665 RepID=UPI0035D4F7C0
MRLQSSHLFQKFFSNLSYAILSNLLVLIVSLLTSLVLPKVLGVKEYSYWQLYLFYSTYVGFLHFGWCDGIYLRYGGQNYNDLNKQSLNGQFYLLFIIQLIFSVLIYLTTLNLNLGDDRKYVIRLITFCLVATNMRWMLVYVLQATNRIKDYAFVMIMDRFIYVFFIIVLLVVGYKSYKLLVVADVIAKVISLAYAIYLVKEITELKLKTFLIDIYDIIENLKSGIKLMFANLASVLMIGIIRLGVERAWDIITFGKISLTLSAARLMMVFINAVGVVLYPLLRKMDDRQISKYYNSIRDLLSPFLLSLLIFYYPLQVVLNKWLPSYKEGLIYFVFVFPICFFEGKMALLNNTFLKVLRKEKLLLHVNLWALAVSLILTLIFTLVYRSLDYLMASVVVVLGLRTFLAELWLSKYIKVNIVKESMIEFGLIFLFILTGSFFGSFISPIWFIIVIAFYIYRQKGPIKKSIEILKKLSNR